MAGATQREGDLAVEAWAALLRAHATLVGVIGREVEAATGLPLSWYDVLLELNSAPGRRLRMQDLGERVVLSRSRVSRIVDDLVRAGLVQRHPDPDDRRATFAVLSDSGRRAFRKAAPVYVAGIRRHFAEHLRPQELRTIRDALQRVLAEREGV